METSEGPKLPHTWISLWLEYCLHSFLLSCNILKLYSHQVYKRLKLTLELVKKEMEISKIQVQHVNLTSVFVIEFWILVQRSLSSISNAFVLGINRKSYWRKSKSRATALFVDRATKSNKKGRLLLPWWFSSRVPTVHPIEAIISSDQAKDIK